MSWWWGCAVGLRFDVLRHRPVPEGVGELAATTGDARLDGADRDVQHLGDLGVVQVGDVAEHHGGAELLGQRLQGVVDRDPVGDGVEAALGHRVDGVRCRRHRPAGRATEAVGAACAARRARRWWRCGTPRCRTPNGRRSWAARGRCRSSLPGPHRRRRVSPRRSAGTPRGRGRSDAATGCPARHGHRPVPRRPASDRQPRRCPPSVPIGSVAWREWRELTVCSTSAPKFSVDFAAISGLDFGSVPKQAMGRCGQPNRTSPIEPR